jgi:hypothetical protein
MTTVWILAVLWAQPDGTFDSLADVSLGKRTYPTYDACEGQRQHFIATKFIDPRPVFRGVTTWRSAHDQDAAAARAFA